MARHSESSVKLYSVFLGEVASIQSYGVFVQIPGAGRKNGLVHKSQMSSTKIENPEDIVTMGECVYCKVISIDDEGKIGLSMKLVNQTTGKDMDPNHIQIALDQQRRKTGHVKEIKGINLGAVYDTTCKKCGGKGHLAQDCFHVPGNEKYDLLPDVDYMMKKNEQSPDKTKEHKSKKKHKKEKKKHKKKRKLSTSDSDDEHQRKKKSKKKKKSKHYSSSDSSSESDSEEDTRKHKHRQRRDSDRTPPRSRPDHSGSRRDDDRDRGRDSRHFNDSRDRGRKEYSRDRYKDSRDNR